RSIFQDPFCFRNHLRQAACFRCLRRYSEAARSAMVADYLFLLSGTTKTQTSSLIHQYWQGLIQEDLSGEESFRALYTPFETEGDAQMIQVANKAFAERHPEFSQCIFTDPHGVHLLPRGAESLPDRQYLLTLGFRNKELGKRVEKAVTSNLPFCPG
ncbi:SPT16 protein, partial [Grallaria varia]|nr:SPT16 protein [Grallaria varia]